MGSILAVLLLLWPKNLNQSPKTSPWWYPDEVLISLTSHKSTHKPNGDPQLPTEPNKYWQQQTQDHSRWIKVHNQYQNNTLKTPKTIAVVYHCSSCLLFTEAKLCKILRWIYPLSSRKVKQGRMILAGFVHYSWTPSNLDLEFSMQKCHFSQ